MGLASAADLIRTAGLRVDGTVRWGERIPSPLPGVYIVSTPEPMANAPIDADALQAWIDRLPGMSVDEATATVATLAARLRSFWIPKTNIVYIGLAGTSVAARVQQFYRTPLGARAPHAGGHWLKTLTGLDAFRVTWAESAAPDDDEDALLRAFAESLPSTSTARLHPRARSSRSPTLRPAAEFASRTASRAPATRGQPVLAIRPSLPSGPGG